VSGRRPGRAGGGFSLKLRVHHRAPSKPKAFSIRLPKGLSRDVAWRLAVARAKRDFRGMKYDPATGVARLI